MRKIFYIILAIALILNSCTKRIDIDLGSTYTRFIVEGFITTDTMAHYVLLTKSTDYYSNTPPPTVSHATVTISNGDSTITLTENDSLPGYYETPSFYYGEPGRLYSLEIELTEEIGGSKNYSASSELMPVASIDSIQITYKEVWEVWEVKIYALDPPTEDFYSFEVYKNNILMTDTINKMGITDDRFFNGNYTHGVTVYYLRDDYEPERVYPGDTIVLRMNGITNEYYDFLLELFEQTFAYRNPLFNGPPANISSNISNGGLGFFTAYSSSYGSTVYKE